MVKTFDLLLSEERTAATYLSPILWVGNTVSLPATILYSSSASTFSLYFLASVDGDNFFPASGNGTEIGTGLSGDGFIGFNLVVCRYIRIQHVLAGIQTISATLAVR